MCHYYKIRTLKKEYHNLIGFSSGRCLRLLETNEKCILFCSTQGGHVLIFDVTSLEFKLLNSYNYGGDIRCTALFRNFFISISSNQKGVKISKISENLDSLSIYKELSNISAHQNGSFDKWMALLPNKPLVMIGSNSNSLRYSIFLFDFERDRAWNFARKGQNLQYSVCFYGPKSFIACNKFVNSFDHRSNKLIRQTKFPTVSSAFSMIRFQHYIVVGQSNTEVLIYRGANQSKLSLTSQVKCSSMVFCVYFKENTDHIYIGQNSSSLSYFGVSNVLEMGND